MSPCCRLDSISLTATNLRQYLLLHSVYSTFCFCHTWRCVTYYLFGTMRSSFLLCRAEVRTPTMVCYYGVYEVCYYGVYEVCYYGHTYFTKDINFRLSTWKNYAMPWAATQWMLHCVITNLRHPQFHKYYKACLTMPTWHEICSQM